MGSLGFGFITNFGGDGLERMEIDWKDTFIPGEHNLEIQLYNNAANVFAAVGAMVTIIILTHIKIRTAISFVSIYNGILWLLMLAASPARFWLVIFIRCLQGLALGFYATSTPMYVFELAPEDALGFLGCMNQVGIGFGGIIKDVLFAFVNWNIYAIVIAIITFIHAAMIWLVPVSKIDPKIVRFESVFQKKYVFKLFSGCMQMIFQQVTGINVICANLPQMLKNIGFDMDKNLRNAITSVAGMMGSIVAGFMMDPLGRVSVWNISCIGLAFGVILYAITLKIDAPNWIPSLAILIYMLFFGIGIGPIPWFIGSEMFPEQVKAMGCACITTTNMIFSFAVGFVFPILVDAITEFGAMMCFTVITLIAVVFGTFCVVELKSDDADNVTLI